MPSALRAYQHELMAEDGSRSLVFGTEDTGYLTLTKPAVGIAEGRDGDTDRSQEDGRRFGRDLRGGKVYTLEVGVLTDAVNGLGGTDPHASNLTHLDTLEAAWQDEWWREQPNRFAVLRSNEAGRLSRCYGRPRSYEESSGALTRKGYTPVVAEFALVDARWYDDTEQQVSCPLVPPSIGGLSGVLTGPLTSTGTGSGKTFADVGGSRSTWPVFTFHGPSTRPWASVAGITVGLTGSIPDGMTVTYDPRPWKRTVLRNDGASLAGQLTYATPLMRKCLLPPGRHEVTYSATDDTATSSVTLKWRDARSRP